MLFYNIYGLDLIGQYDVAASEEFYHLMDHLGNIRVTIDDDWNVLSYNDYYPFGMQMSGRVYNQRLANDLYKYNSKELDEETGLDWYYFGARFYDPEVGRWFVTDPLSDQYPSLSSYTFVGNRPLIAIDPDGKRIINPRNHVLANKLLIARLKKFDANVSRLSGLSSSQFTFVITGGDRYKGANGKIFESSDRNWVKRSASDSRHLEIRGGLAVDLSIPSNPEITDEIVEQAAREAGLLNDEPVKYSDHYHLSLAPTKINIKFHQKNKYVPLDKDFVNPTIKKGKIRSREDAVEFWRKFWLEKMRLKINKILEEITNMAKLKEE